PKGAGCDASEFDEEKAFWFGEPVALVVVSIGEADQEKMRDLLDEFEDVDFVEVGEVISEARLVLPGGELLSLEELRNTRNTLPAFGK
ncbi:MAG TPA: hypothetical protein PKD58_07570, partial [Candidatus Sumerlaeota bacterium]|nr:hypothetical protein [Candidatus Sumerlaeota bacterium]